MFLNYEVEVKNDIIKETFWDTKWVIRNRNWKTDRQHNDKNKRKGTKTNNGL